MPFAAASTDPLSQAAHLTAVVKIAIRSDAHSILETPRQCRESEWAVAHATRQTLDRQAAGNASAATGTRTRYGLTRLVPNHDVWDVAHCYQTGRIRALPNICLQTLGESDELYTPCLSLSLSSCLFA